MLKILTHSLLGNGIWVDSFFFNKFYVNFLLSLYSHQGRGIPSEHWLTDVFWFFLVSRDIIFMICGRKVCNVLLGFLQNIVLLGFF